ncbi:hypothetical protein [Streptococcus merionis]|uniref:Uncharacterized protein n=1 Tax=Streptococcus merionis TaxID=400065 RepID=A0A239SU18_9STRE|nr:hypothetical protein [Streptococcus merionis]SNU88722.1 Uncharacterised protein [Streptococcus merionis]
MVNYQYFTTQTTTASICLNYKRNETDYFYTSLSEDSYADLVISLVIAIDYVKEQEAIAANSSTSSH